MLLGKPLRSDYILYLVGIVLLAVTGYALFDRASWERVMGGMLIYSAIVFVLALFGITSFIFGYNMRPRKQKIPSITPSHTVESLMELTRVKGIGEKRAEQLKALGISTVPDLSAASAEELAEKLQISSKITNRWIKEARNLLLEK
jgi:hypothetical protein